MLKIKNKILLSMFILIIVSTLIIEIIEGQSEKKEENLLMDFGYSNMSIIGYKINEFYSIEKDYVSSELSFNSTLVKENKDKIKSNSVSQKIYIKNILSKEQTLNISILVKIDYNKIRWRGDDYYLNSTPLKLDSWYENETLIVPNIFFDDVYNKRINYRDIATIGGYALAYEKEKENFIELIIENLKIDSEKDLLIDPTYSNETTGFSTSAIGATSIYGVQLNSSLIYLWDSVDKAEYVTNLSGANQSALGFSIPALSDATGHCGNNSDLFLVHYWGSVQWYSKAGVNISGFTIPVGGEGIACEQDPTTGAINDLWVLLNGAIAHYLIDGTNQTDACKLPTGIDAPKGLLTNRSDKWFFDTTDLSINHTLKDCSIASYDPGFDITSFGMGGGMRGMGGFENHFRLFDLFDEFLFDIACTGDGCPMFGGITDTCSYTSGDWNINCADNCTISSEVTASASKYNMTIKADSLESGTIIIDAKVSGFNYYKIFGDCIVRCNNDCINMI